MPKDFSRKDITTSQNLALGALSYTTSIGSKFKLTEVAVKFSIAATETITITRDSVNGVNYDHILRSESLVAEQNFVFRPQGECIFEAGDELKVQCTNAGIAVCYVVIKTMEKS